MDLYEALKGGVSEEELKASFEKELESARSRVQEEAQASRDKKIIDAARANFISAAIDYAEAIAGEDDFSDFQEELEETLKTYEAEMGAFKDIIDFFGEKFANGDASVNVKISTDDDILKAFIKSL